MKKLLAATIMALAMLATHPAGALTAKDTQKNEELRESAVDLFSQGHYEEALPLLKEVLSVNPDDKVAQRYLLIFNRQVVEPYCKRAADAYLAGDYPEAIAQWEKILLINPADRRVQALIDSTILETNDDVIDNLYALANDFMKDGDFDKAASEIEKILVTNPEEKRANEMLLTVKRTIADSTIEGHYEKADSYLKKKEYDLAISEWKHILDIDPNQEVASRQIAAVQRAKLNDMYSMARETFQRGDYIEARDLYSRILADNPTDIATKHMINRLNETINVIPKLSERGVSWDLARQALANYISENGNPQVAVVASWYAVQKDTDNTLVAAIRDFIETRNISVIRSMETPVKDMDIVDQYLFASLNHIYEGRYDLAIQQCTLVLELEPENTMALKRLGSAYFALGKKKQARDAWEQALKLSPEDEELREFIRQAR